MIKLLRMTNAFFSGAAPREWLALKSKSGRRVSGKSGRSSGSGECRLSRRSRSRQGLTDFPVIPLRSISSFRESVLVC